MQELDNKMFVIDVQRRHKKSNWEFNFRKIHIYIQFQIIHGHGLMISYDN